MFGRKFDLYLVPNDYAITRAYNGLHRLRVLHRDAELRNILWDGEKAVVVDFERAEYRSRKPLGVLHLNGQNVQGIKRKRRDDFEEELHSILGTGSLRIGGSLG
jgi:hypothetical protein